METINYKIELFEGPLDLLLSLIEKNKMKIEDVRIDLLCEQPDGDTKTELIRSLAIYMRQQYLIWNKDSVADETIFADIEKLSNYRLTIPEGLNLSKISGDANFSRPGMGINVGQAGKNNNRQRRQNRRTGKKK